MAAYPPKSVHFQAAEGHTIGLPFSWLLLLGQAKEVTRALTQKYLRSNASPSVRENINLAKIRFDNLTHPHSKKLNYTNPINTNTQ